MISWNNVSNVDFPFPIVLSLGGPWENCALFARFCFSRIECWLHTALICPWISVFCAASKIFLWMWVHYYFVHSVAWMSHESIIRTCSTFTRVSNTTSLCVLITLFFFFFISIPESIGDFQLYGFLQTWGISVFRAVSRFSCWRCLLSSPYRKNIFHC